ncbi:MAG: DNA recombination protein RmuC [Betaproteobacteria bacterium]|nr:MAG: DNA recombination protein RmuC [Betaproteobacteria bacterium]
MNAAEWQFGWVVAAAVLGSVAGAWIAQRAGWRRQQALSAAALDARIERLERELRQTIDASADRASMQIGARVAQLQDALTAHVTQITGVQAEQLGGYGRVMQQQLADLTAAIQRHLAEVRTTLETRLQALQQGNETRLEQMRATVEEKLQTTLDGRLGESFRLVSERLEQVHRGLGEMQALAAGVGDLKRVLGNVKSRGVFGEVQLAALLEQVLLADQYAANVATRPGSSDRVDFAIRLPGRNGDTAVWLPIDAKFPIEDYERLVAAQERADAAGAEEAGRALENRVRGESRTLREKYVEPPHTTDFAVLFLPTEGLFAEVLRRPGLAEALNRELRVVVAGPTTLAAMLNSLQMGFRTLAIEQRSSEVWQVLGAVKTEFARFGEWLGRVREQVGTVSRTLEQADTRTKQMQRKLREVEALPAEQAVALLPAVPRDEEEE